jgi:hypothetical protein
MKDIAKELGRVFKDTQEDEEEASAQQNPWQPYKGPSGGEGWVNVLTNEVRYQESQPEPREGLSEGEELPEDIPEITAPSDDIDESWYELPPVDPDDVKEGDSVVVDGKAYDVVEPTDAGFVLEDDEGNEFQVLDDEVDALNPKTPPEGMYQEGWKSPPDSELEAGLLWEGQTVEYYDLEEGKYKQAQLTDIHNKYLQAESEDGDSVEMTIGYSNPEHADVLTAVEDPLPEVEYDSLDPMDEDEFLSLEQEDEILIPHPKDPEAGPVKAEVVTAPDPGEVTATADLKWTDGETVGHGSIYATDLGHKPVYNVTEYVDPEEILMWGDELHWDELDGFRGNFEHPQFGTVGGLISINQDSQGNKWATIDTEEVDEEVSLSLEEDHPLYIGDYVEDVDNIWENPPEEYHNLSEINAGADVLLDMPEGKKRKTVMDIGADPAFPGQAVVHTADGEEYAMHELDDVDIAGYQEAPNYPYVPNDALTNEWQSVGAAFTTLENGDTLLYIDDEGNMKQGKIETVSAPKEAHLTNGDKVGVDRAIRYADTGDPLPETDIETFGLNQRKDVVRAEVLEGDEVKEVEGTFLHANHPHVSIATTDGEIKTYEDGNISVTEVLEDADPQEYGIKDGTEVETDEIIEDLKPEGGWHTGGGAYLSKAEAVRKFWTDKAEQQTLKADFKKYFDPDEVEKFYEDIDGWKYSSTKAREIEAAFTYAFDLDSPIRAQDRPNDPLPYSEDELEEMVAMAEVAGELSREHYEKHVGEWYRGGKPAGLVTTLSDFLEDPHRETYDFNGLALNNGNNNPHNTWNDYRIAPGHKLPTENVMLATDHMFNPGGSHSNENEIWVHGDLEVDAEDIHIDHDQKLNLSGSPEDWSDEQLGGVAKSLAKYAPGMFDPIGDQDFWYHDAKVHGVTGDITEDQLRNLHEIAQKAIERGVADADVTDMKDSVEAVMMERGMDQIQLEPPERFENVEDYTEGMEVEVYSNFEGDIVDGEVTDVFPEHGVINVEDVYGNTLEVKPKDFSEVVWSPDGSHKDPKPTLGEYVEGKEGWEVGSEWDHKVDDFIAVPDNDFEDHLIFAGDQVAISDGFGNVDIKDVEEVSEMDNTITTEMGTTHTISDIVALPRDHEAVSHLQIAPKGEESVLGPSDFEAYDPVWWYNEEGELSRGTAYEMHEDEVVLSGGETKPYGELVPGNEVRWDSLEELEEGDEVYVPEWGETYQVGELVEGMGVDEGEITGLKVADEDGNTIDLLDADQVAKPEAAYSTEASADKVVGAPVEGSNVAEGDYVRHPEHGKMEVIGVKDYTSDPSVDVGYMLDVEGTENGVIDSLSADEFYWSESPELDFEPSEVGDIVEDDPIYFEIPENYEGAGEVGEVLYVTGDARYEDPEGNEAWIDQSHVADNAVSVGEPPEMDSGAKDPHPQYNEAPEVWDEISSDSVTEELKQNFGEIPAVGTEVHVGDNNLSADSEIIGYTDYGKVVIDGEDVDQENVTDAPVEVYPGATIEPIVDSEPTVVDGNKSQVSEGYSPPTEEIEGYMENKPQNQDGVYFSTPEGLAEVTAVKDGEALYTMVGEGDSGTVTIAEVAENIKSYGEAPKHSEETGFNAVEHFANYGTGGTNTTPGHEVYVDENYDHYPAGQPIEVGHKVELWDGEAQGIFVDVVGDFNMKVYVEESEHSIHSPGEFITVYPSDEPKPMDPAYQETEDE